MPNSGVKRPTVSDVCHPRLVSSECEITRQRIQPALLHDNFTRRWGKGISEGPEGGRVAMCLARAEKAFSIRQPSPTPYIQGRLPRPLTEMRRGQTWYARNVLLRQYATVVVHRWMCCVKTLLGLSMSRAVEMSDL